MGAITCLAAPGLLQVGDQARKRKVKDLRDHGDGNADEYSIRVPVERFTVWAG